MDLELKGKTAIVTGGSQGIGKAIALQLAHEGVDLVICSRRQEILDEAASEIASKTGRKVIACAADMTRDEDVERLIGTAVKSLGGIQILINNAALPGGLVTGPLSEANVDDLMLDINTKVLGYLRCAKAVAPHMEKDNWGRIVNIGGLASRNGGTISGLRNLSLVHLTKTLSGQLGSSGITVNVVHPGLTRTESTVDQAKAQGLSVQEYEKQAGKNITIGRLVDASEIAYLIAFICSPKAEAITGESIAAGGGLGEAVYP